MVGFTRSVHMPYGGKSQQRNARVNSWITAVVALVFIFVVVKYGIHRFEYTPANAGPYTLHKIKQTIIMGVMIIVYIVYSIMTVPQAAKRSSTLCTSSR